MNSFEPTIDPPSAILRKENAIPDAPKTAIVVGIARGGTSATTGVLDAIGFPAATDGEPDGHFETPVFKADPHSDSAWEALLEKVREMDHVHDNWSLQAWPSTPAVQRIAKAVRGPHLVIVWRDLAAVIQRHLHVQEYGRDTPTLLYHVWAVQAEMWYLATHCDLPTILLSYERLKTTSRTTIDKLAMFLGVELTPTQRGKATARISPRGGYLIQ